LEKKKKIQIEKIQIGEAKRIHTHKKAPTRNVRQPNARAMFALARETPRIAPPGVVARRNRRHHHQENETSSHR
jgi:hypothetical protein